VKFNSAKLPESLKIEMTPIQVSNRERARKIFHDAQLKPRLGPDGWRETFRASDYRNKDHPAAWLFAMQSAHYDIKLQDDSLIQLDQDEESASFSFLRCPYPDLPAKIQAEFADDFDMLEDIRGAQEPAYAGHFIRLDWDPSTVRPGNHPAWHWHICNNDIRIQSNRGVRVEVFVFSVLRWFYPTTWTKMLESKTFHTFVTRQLRHKSDWPAKRAEGSIELLELELATPVAD
jgi:hypothetical protein